MAPLVLEGETLGERHQHYNKLVKEAIQSDVSVSDLNEKDTYSDIDALLRVDLASHRRDVDYILEVLKSEDMLLVSRAIKKSSWLITDNQYEHLINMKYLEENLFPKMTSKAICKLLLSIRLNLKEESRVDQFYKHYENEDLNSALRWLPHCSVKVMEEAVTKHHNAISLHLFKRLCEKTMTVLDVLLKTPVYEHTKGNYVKVAMFLLNTEPEKFVNIAEQLPKRSAPVYGAKHTEILMKSLKNRVLDKFNYYSRLVHLPTLGKCLGKENIKDFLMKLARSTPTGPDDEVFNYKQFKPLIDLMPTEGKFDFIKSVFIDKKIGNAAIAPPVIPRGLQVESFCAMSGVPRSMKKKKKKIQPSSSQRNVYEMYRHAPFPVAFEELKNLIRIEASADERSAMLGVLVGCTRRRQPHVHALLQYYHDKHINEPFKNKVQFVNSIITKTHVHRYIDEQWKLLQVLFQSMDVYSESENYVQKCLEAEIVYRTLRGEEIPDIIIKKFDWNTMKHFQSQLNSAEKEKIFQFLYKIKENKFSTQKIDDDPVTLLEELVTLLVDWNKDIADYPIIISRIKELLQLKKEPCLRYYEYINHLLNNKKKSWRRHLFEESLIMNPSEEAVINALKHDPELLSRYQDKVAAVRANDNIFPKRLLRILRTYWPALANEWSAACRLQLSKPGGHKAATRALCTLLPPTEFTPFVQHYVPEDLKINWQVNDTNQINMQKIVAQSLHLARPQPPLDVVLLFLKGDYVQFALPSLSGIFYNMSALKSRERIGELLDSPVSIQKHAIRFAVVKQGLYELQETVKVIWKNTKNYSIRAVIFQIIFDQLCKQKNKDKVNELWELLSDFIDSLSEKENKAIYTLLTKVEAVPEVVQGKFCEKSYRFLKTLPKKLGFENSVKMLAGYTATIIERMDPQFIHELIVEYINVCFSQDTKQLSDHNMRNVIVANLLCAHSDQVQMERYKKTLVPIIEFIFDLWDVEVEKEFIYRQYFRDLFGNLLESMATQIAKPMNVIPTKIISAVYKTLESQADRIQYITLETWALTVKFLECAEKVKATLERTDAEDEKVLENSQNKEWDLLCYRVIPEFSVVCINRLIEAISTRFPSINIIYAKVLQQLKSQLIASNSPYVGYKFYKSILEESRDASVYVAVVHALSGCGGCWYDKDLKVKLDEIKKLIREHPSEEVKMHYFSIFPVIIDQ